MFDAMVLGPAVAELMQQGYLARARAYARLAAGEDLRAIRSTGGDYDRKQLAALMLRLPVTEAAVRDYLDMGEDRAAFAFCVGRHHARAVAEAFIAAGVPAASLDGTAPEREREAVLERFGAGKIRMLASCDLLTEGFDAPEAAVALLLRPTRSLALHRQMVGRVLRPKADGGEALLLDYSGNLVAHGLPDMPVAWSLAGRGGRTMDEQETRCRSCPACGAVLAPAVRTCAECGHELRRPSSEIAGVDPGELVDEQGIARLRGMSYAKAVATAESFEHLKLIGRARGYKRGWAFKVAPELGIAISEKAPVTFSPTAGTS
jgi:superfamily II DNA or RNA helicase